MILATTRTLRRALPIAALFTLATSLVACTDSTSDSAELKPLHTGTLDLEIRHEAVVRIASTEVADRTEVNVTLSKGHDLVPDGTTLTGAGRIDRYPEADATLYTARFAAPALAGDAALCGTEAVSLALSLHTDADNAVVAGALTPYCGANRWYGIPAREPLRLRGSFD
jgi:hypothetical protein